MTKDGAESRDSVSGETIEPGRISGYSNAGFVRPFDRYDPVLERGPRRGVKPEIVAPGQWHVAAACELTPSSRLDASGKYKRFNGTSASTTYTAGVVALLMEKNGDLTADEFRALLKTGASKPDGIRELPHPLWGFGKLDITAVDELIRQTKAKGR